MAERKARPVGEFELALAAKVQRGGEPTVQEYLDAANKSSPLLRAMRKDQLPSGLEGPSRRMSRREQKLERESKLGFNSATEKQRPKGKPNARDWKVQSAKGGAFCLVHRESGDYYADYVVTPITSWGAKRFPTVGDAYTYLNSSKYFTQGTRPQSSWNQTKTRGDKVNERFRKRMGFQD